jgi:methionyl aminopeptidase
MSKNENIKIKTPEEIKIMKEGGEKLARVKKELEARVGVGVSAYEIEELACDLIKKEGAEVSFKKVPGYYWATCVNVNEGIVHGIPKKDLIFKNGDIVSVDCGVFYKGFHTDTSFTKGVGVDNFKKKFIEAGKIALKKAIVQARVGNRIYDISEAIESELKKKNLTPIRALVGHGVGRDLHEAPQIYCYTNGNYEESPEIREGMVLAIEVMYSLGSADLKLDKDRWTISTSDDTISGLFEDTIAVTKKGPIVLTD